MSPPPLGRLHLITDARPGRDALAVVRAALSVARPGAAAVQVRIEDRVTDREAYDLAARIAALCAQHGSICLVNDRLHIALAVGAAGGHVGAQDLPVDAARRVLGSAAVLGATVREPVSARAAVAAGASYLGVGPAFPTSTKDGLTAPLGPSGIAAVAAALPRFPIIAVGGVTAARVPDLLAAGAYGVAVVGALAAAADPARAAAELLLALESRMPGDDSHVCPTGTGP